MLLNLRVGPNFNRARIGYGVVVWNMRISIEIRVGLGEVGRVGQCRVW